MSAAERLYNSLPAVYRLRDSAQGEQLRALLAMIETELDAVEADVSGLYENWFIETCDEWVVPYIGDLLRVLPLHPVSPGTFSQRAYVARTLSYRRRKGTAAMLEQLARDVTGWPARAVEFFSLLDTTQYLNHVRLPNVRTPDLRDTNQLELLGGPFERIAHTVDVRHIASNRGKYNIPSLGLFLWRLQGYEITRGVARPVADPPDGRYRFDPLGDDIPLFNRPETGAAGVRPDGERSVPGMLRRRALYDELEALRRAIANRQTPIRIYFSDQPVFRIFKNEQVDPVSPEQIMICDLSDPQQKIPEGWRRPPTGLVSVDPVLGRLAFPVNEKLTQVQVSYAYAAAGDLGGGPYDRRDAMASWLDQRRPVTWQVGVTHDPKVLAADQASGAKQLMISLRDAIAFWNTTGSRQAGAFGVIAIMDNSTYKEDLVGRHGIQVPAGCKLAIVAADWPTERVAGRLIPDGVRPHLQGSVEVAGTGVVGNLGPGALVLDGLLVEGALTVLAGTIGELLISHSTLVPKKGGLTVNQTDPLSIAFKRSICGPIAAPETMTEVRVLDSIIDAGHETSVAYSAALDGQSAGAPLQVENATIIGKVHTVFVRLASNTVFVAGLAGNDSWPAPVIAERRQEGCVRFTYLPTGSRTPKRYRCQPDPAVQNVSEPAAQDAIRARVTPLFASLAYGKPAYAQLDLACAAEIRAGAEDGSEMGVFSFLKQPQREANLRASLEEYLRFGLEAGLYFVT